MRENIIRWRYEERRDVTDVISKLIARVQPSMKRANGMKTPTTKSQITHRRRRSCLLDLYNIEHVELLVANKKTILLMTHEMDPDVTASNKIWRSACDKVSRDLNANRTTAAGL
ncbi:hypothetical protein FRC04_001144 [Tulasnella sp. 424]|nr:hypothetical protein FRC04_001144 [Tulasnella sp. 424]